MAGSTSQRRATQSLLDLRRGAALAWTLAGFALPLLADWLLRRPPDLRRAGRRLREAFQRLGVTYVKLGQFLAMRFDILPDEICKELAQLFDRVPPVAAHWIRRTIEEEFDRPLEDVYDRFEWEPIAAASIAQVHRARLAGGQEVAVKVQRPGILEVFGSDMRNLRRAARLADRLRLLGPQSTREAVDEFHRFTQREMNFRTEARTAERLRNQTEGTAHVPRVYWEQTTSRVLTMEFVHGHRLSEVIAAGAAGGGPVDVGRAIRTLAHATLRQLFVTGFFHADPHPGNIFVMPDGSVTFIDFGIFGELPPQRRELISSYIENVALGNMERGYAQFRQLLTPTSRTDHYKLKLEVKEIFRRWYEASADPLTPPAERHLGRYVGEFIAAIRRNNVTMDIDTLLFWRALVTLDATALRFRERFDLLEVMERFFSENRPSLPERVAGMAADQKAWEAAARLVLGLPQQVAALSRGDACSSRRVVEKGLDGLGDDAEERASGWLGGFLAAGSLLAVATLGALETGVALTLAAAGVFLFGRLAWMAWRA